jgi:hypothetical protein
MRSNHFGAMDDMQSWMRVVTKRLQQGVRKGRVDLLGSTIEEETAGELTVRTVDEIPEGLPFGSPVFVIETQQVVRQDPDTREWEPPSTS